MLLEPQNNIHFQPSFNCTNYINLILEDGHIWRWSVYRHPRKWNSPFATFDSWKMQLSEILPMNFNDFFTGKVQTFKSVTYVTETRTWIEKYYVLYVKCRAVRNLSFVPNSIKHRYWCKKIIRVRKMGWIQRESLKIST
jgi:hypothetical protein